jgi:hypothetical protein
MTSWQTNKDVVWRKFSLLILVVVYLTRMWARQEFPCGKLAFFKGYKGSTPTETDPAPHVL